MSVKSASDRNSQDEAIRRSRETYQNRETENAKKHGQQVKNLTESAQAELEKVKADHARQMEELKTKTREAITSRDMHYQKEIDEMREMHQKQIQRVALEAEGREGRTEQALRAELDRVQATSQQQRDILTNEFSNELSKRDRAMGEYAVNTRKAQQEAAVEQKQRLTQTHAKELNALVKDRNERLTQESNEQAALRRASADQVKSLNRSHQLERDRLIADHGVSVKNEKENSRQNAEFQREEMQFAIKKNRERFEKATEEIRGNSDASVDNLERTVNGRLNDKVRQLETDKQNLKHELVRTRVKGEKEKAVEVRNLRDNLTANIENLEKSRRETVGAANEKTKQELGQVVKKNEDLVARTNRFHQDNKVMDDLRNDERFSKTQLEYEKHIGHEKATNESRFNKLHSSNEMEQGKLRAYFERATTSMKENFETTLREMRDRNKRDQEQIFSQFTKQAQENDMKFQEKLGNISTRYERQIAEMQEKHLKDLKDQQSLSDRQKGELVRKGEQDLKTLSSQFEYRISKMEDGHKREIETLNRKHEETLANLTKTRQA